MTFTQTLYANEAIEAARCDASCLTHIEFAYNEVIDCRVPRCHSSLSLVADQLTTTVILHQVIAGDAASLSTQRARELADFYSDVTDCRVPFCQATLAVVTGSIKLRILLSIPDSPNGPSTVSSTAATVTTAANALAARPVDELSAMMNETVVSTSLPVVSRARLLNVSVVLSIPDAASSGDASDNASPTVATITAAANAVANRPTAIASLLNATVISTSPVVVGRAVVPLVVSTTTSTGRGTPMDVILFALLIALMVTLVACARLWRGRQDWCAPLALTTQKQLLVGGSQHEGEAELTSSPTASEHRPVTRASLAKERVREERRQESVGGLRKGRASSYVEEAEGV